jgi:hypothetical protein
MIQLEYPGGLVAQWKEHMATNHGVGGSNPSLPDIKNLK